MSATYAIKPHVRARQSGKTTELKAAHEVALDPVKGIKHTGFYDFGPVLSHNCLLNMIAGARGIGKTFGAKKLGINRWIKKREQFILLRRFEEELKSLDQFFADIAHEFTDWDFRTNGRRFEIAPASTRDDKKREWEVIGFAVALSTSQTKKGVSYHNVTLVIFDEFILEKSALHYLPNEAEILLNFFSTVDRFREKTTFLMLANAVTIDNPYMTYFKILPDKEFIKDSGPAKFWLAHFPKSEEFKASIDSTRFGQFLKNNAADYYDYAVKNQFADNHLHLVKLKSADALHFFNLETKAGSFAVWQDTNAGLWYATSKMPAGQLMLTLLPDKMTEQKTLVFINDPIIIDLLASFRNKALYFDTPATRNVFLDLFTLSGRRTR